MLLVNEMYKLWDLPFNLKATMLIDGHHDRIQGPAIIMSAEEFQMVKRQASGEYDDE